MQLKFCTLTVLACLSVSAATAVGTGDLNDAIAKFNAGQYEASLQVLNQGNCEPARVAEAHYYKGCCLVHLKRHPEAIKEFKLAKLLGKGGSVSASAESALTAYGEATQTDKAKAAAAASQAAANSQIDPPSVKTTARKITSQAEERINRIWSDARQSSSYSNAPAYTIPNMTRNKPSTPTGFAGPSSVAGFDSRYKYYQYGQRWNPYLNSPEHAFHRQRAKNVADSAEGLVSLLTRNDDGKGVYLVPQGTNLYVRNYEFGASIDPVILPMKTDMKMLSAKRIPLSAQTNFTQEANKADAAVAPEKEAKGARLVGAQSDQASTDWEEEEEETETSVPSTPRQPPTVVPPQEANLTPPQRTPQTSTMTPPQASTNVDPSPANPAGK
jgi:hypothetical protein